MNQSESKLRIQAVPVIYLAGGMKSDWQDKVMTAIPNAIYIDPRNHNCKDEASYTQWDLAGVERSDVIFGFMEKDNPGGAGLAVEFGWAARARKYIVYAEENGHGSQRYFGMVRSVADVHFAGENGQAVLQHAIDHLKSLIEKGHEFGKPTRT